MVKLLRTAKYNLVKSLLRPKSIKQKKAKMNVYKMEKSIIY